MCESSWAGDTNYQPNVFVTGMSAGVGTFEWALSQMKRGFAVRRSNWNHDLRIYMDDVNKVVVKECNDHKGSVCSFHYEDFLAVDWEYYTPKCDKCGK